jgi:hypothetical protein
MIMRRTTRFFNLVAATALSAVLAFTASAPVSASGIIILPTTGVAGAMNSVIDADILIVWSGIIILPTTG